MLDEFETRTGLMTGFIVLMGILSIWSIVWKGVALWKSARRGEKGWFIVFLVVNTVAILEIIYIFMVSKKPKIEQGGSNNAPGIEGAQGGGVTGA